MNSTMLFHENVESCRQRISAIITRGSINLGTAVRNTDYTARAQKKPCSSYGDSGCTDVKGTIVGT